MTLLGPNGLAIIGGEEVREVRNGQAVKVVIVETLDLAFPGAPKIRLPAGAYYIFTEDDFDRIARIMGAKAEQAGVS